jgi:hypothetical protein
MKKYPSAWWLTLLALAISVVGMVSPGVTPAQAQQVGFSSQAKPAEIQIPNGPLPIRILVQSPADTVTDLQIICLFQSNSSNTLHGSLVDINEKLKGLLDKVRKPDLFRGESGETILITPPAGSMKARKLLIIGLGDSETFTPQRMESVGTIVYREATRLGELHPFFAPTILDGGVTKFGTGQVSEEVVSGFLRAARTQSVLKSAGVWQGQIIQSFTFLAGPTHASETRQGIEKAITAEATR